MRNSKEVFMYELWVIYDEEFGVYLGNFMGLGFWSNLDAAGQSEAPTFVDYKEATDYLATLGNSLPKTTAVAVICNNSDYATVDECVKAGLPSWSAS